MEYGWTEPCVSLQIEVRVFSTSCRSLLRFFVVFSWSFCTQFFLILFYYLWFLSFRPNLYAMSSSRISAEWNLPALNFFVYDLETCLIKYNSNFSNALLITIRRWLHDNELRVADHEHVPIARWLRPRGVLSYPASQGRVSMARQ